MYMQYLHGMCIYIYIHRETRIYTTVYIPLSPWGHGVALPAYSTADRSNIDDIVNPRPSHDTPRHANVSRTGPRTTCS